MKITLFSSKGYDETFFGRANEGGRHELRFLEARLTPDTASLAESAGAVCAFANDDVGEAVLETLAGFGIRLIALRSAGFNHVDLKAAKRLGMTVVRVPAYSPHAVAEHTVALMLALNRKIPRAVARVREGNFSLEGLLGFDLRGKTVGVVGAGKIGRVVAKILLGFESCVLAFDPQGDDELKAAGVSFVDMPELLAESQVVTLHCPLNDRTRHLIDADAVAAMREGVMLINTGRGALVDTKALIGGLKSGRIGSVGLDVYEEESDLFFEDHSGDILTDDVFARLLTFPNVIVTGHQGFFTREALTAIAETTLQNVTDVEEGRDCPNTVEAS